MFSIEEISNATRPVIDAQIAQSWAGPYIVTKGVLHDTRTHPGFAAVESGEVIGYVLYHMAHGDCEITVLESLRAGCGVGGALMNEAIRVARESACRRVWLITTNDNTCAMRFYQRIGFDLLAVHRSALNTARKLKPQIPLIGCDDIPVKHEIEFEIIL